MSEERHQQGVLRRQGLPDTQYFGYESGDRGGGLGSRLGGEAALLYLLHFDQNGWSREEAIC